MRLGELLDEVILNSSRHRNSFPTLMIRLPGRLSDTPSSSGSEHSRSLGGERSKLASTWARLALRAFCVLSKPNALREASWSSWARGGAAALDRRTPVP